MRLHIIRHADPDYAQDILTPLGCRQAEALSVRMAALPIRAIYASPYGRACATAQYSADKLGLEVQVLPWAREMNDVTVPGKLRPDMAVWHIPPRELMAAEATKAGNAWSDAPAFAGKGAALQERVRELREGADALLAPLGLAPVSGGYSLREDLSGWGDIALFCHQGAGLTLIAHLLNICPVTLWRACYIAPTSVTTMLLEQSEAAFASFRALQVGDISHLASAGVEAVPLGLLYNRA